MHGLLSALRSLVLSGLAASALTLVSLPVQALPEGTDAISRFLQERFAVDGTATASTSSRAEDLLGGVRETASDLVLSAMNFLGVRYRFGGTSEETGFDCSGFTRHVFENSVGLLLPRRSSEQAQAPGLLSIRQDDLKPGDLVFFNTMRSAFSHVGIYVGEGKFIHAPRTGSTIRVDDMHQDYWLRRFDGARRVPQLSTSSPSRSLNAANAGN
ncbi:C40 family peptidase [Sphaerotilus sp.]|uniref:C40 family peptidase n=1 Tax=Sphaerotilus sp. TaxID=2093942 RepID=UPI0034E2ACA3